MAIGSVGVSPAYELHDGSVEAPAGSSDQCGTKGHDFAGSEAYDAAGEE